MSSSQPEPSIERWICPNCGQTYFGEDPPDMCDFCGDFTTWKPAPPLQPEPKIEQKAVSPERRPNHDDDDRSIQLPLL